jgi:hypothetical protein
MYTFHFHMGMTIQECALQWRSSMARDMAAWAKEKVEEQWGDERSGPWRSTQPRTRAEYLYTMPPRRLGVEVGVEEVVAVLPPARTTAAQPARCPLLFPFCCSPPNTRLDAVSLAATVASVLVSQ